MNFTNTGESFPPSFTNGDVIMMISGYVEENHGLTKVGNVSIDFFISMLDGEKYNVAGDILTDSNGDFEVTIPLSNPGIGKYFITAEPSGIGYQKQLESNKQILEFFIVPSTEIYVPITPNKILAPLKQIKNGIENNEIECKNELSFVIKKSNSMPACVKPASVQKLIDRGWALK